MLAAGINSAPTETSTGGVRSLLRMEGAVALLASIAAYRYLGLPWALFAVLFLVPDLSILGYLRGPRFGAIVYNLLHTYAGPALLAVVGWALGLPTIIGVAAIWSAHIGLDRALGLGLKLPTGFRDTHLGRAPGGTVGR